jgi:hypothetical protein
VKENPSGLLVAEDGVEPSLRGFMSAEDGGVKTVCAEIEVEGAVLELGLLLQASLELIYGFLGRVGPDVRVLHAGCGKYAHPVRQGLCRASCAVFKFHSNFS